MGRKKKQDQRRDDSSSSSSSDAKRRRSRHYHVGDTSRANGGTPPEGIVGVFRDAVLEFKDAIQVKVSTESKFKRKIDKLKLKRQKDKEKRRKDNQDLSILKDSFEILKEELRILKEGHEDHKSKIQEMQKGGCAEVDHHRASPSQRSQPSESPRFNLRIETIVSSTIYKREAVTTKDGSGRIKVAMYDGDLPIASNHALASVRVDLVVINGLFNKGKKASWSREEFEENIIKPRDSNSMVKNDTFNLNNGSCHHEGAIIMDNSQQKEVKLGVMVTLPTQVRVLEGVSNPFKVQESKTKDSKKKNKKPSPSAPAPNLEQPTSTQATQHDRGKHKEFPTHDTGEDNGLSYPPAIVQQMVEGNGEASYLDLILSCCPPPHSIQDPLQTAGHCPVNQPLLACGQDQYTSFPNASYQLALPNLYAPLNETEWGSFLEDDTTFQTQVQETYGTFRCDRVLLQWDNPHMELKEHWNFLDQIMPLYSTKSRFYTGSFPSTSLMDKAHKLLASISTGDTVSKMITIGMSQATQTIQRRGILIRPFGPYDCDEPPVKKQRNVKYKLRFLNKARYDYYTREQITSEDGNLLKVALFDENNVVVTSGPLSSACAEVVVLHGDFNAEGHEYWTPEEFSTCLVHSQYAKEPPAMGGDRVLALTDGEADLVNVNFHTSSFHARTGKFKMGVVIKNVREETVQEGITSPFLVRVRLGEEPSRQITSLESLLIVGTNQVCAALERDARENVSTSSVVKDEEDYPQKKKDEEGYFSKFRMIIQKRKDKEDYLSKLHMRIQRALLSTENKDDTCAAIICRKLERLEADVENLECKSRQDVHDNESESCSCFDCELKRLEQVLKRLEDEVASSGCVID